MKQDIIKFSWVGSEGLYLDTPSVVEHKHMVIGRYGGNRTAGASKNEDGLFILQDPGENWEFVMLLDAHQIADSAELLVRTIRNMGNIHLQTL